MLFEHFLKSFWFQGPTTCGKPEQPPNSTLTAPNFGVGSRIEYSCDEGHLLVGPSQRTCLPTGFYSEFPPVCRCKWLITLLWLIDNYTFWEKIQGDYSIF